MNKTRNRKQRQYAILSLGCAKNTVDAESMAALLEQAGYQCAESPEKADVVIVNTCGFIDPARRESLDVLQELAETKKKGQALIAAGCWSQRDPQAILVGVPQIDGVIGTQHWMDIVSLADQIADSGLPTPQVHMPQAASPRTPDVPRVAVQGKSAYIKIADGCSRSCAFCAIPLIKGAATSRPPELILAEAAALANQGIQEIILIAQDTTAYGRDLGMTDGIAHLLEKMVECAPQVPWIRLMYAFPGAVTARLIDVMAQCPQVLPYLDIPLQHTHSAVLRRMRRPSDRAWVTGTLATLREKIPEIAIRTTFIVGYPGETEEEFAALVDAVQNLAFDRVGVFVYSPEIGTQAASLPDDVPNEIKEYRRDLLMQTQQPISLAKNQALIGKTLDVLVEGEGEGLIVGRTYRDAPEIDGLVLIEASTAVSVEPGTIVHVLITDALEYDLVGKILPTA